MSTREDNSFGAKLNRVLKSASGVFLGKLKGGSSKEKIFVTQETLDSISNSLTASDVSESAIKKIMDSSSKLLLHKNTTGEEIKRIIFGQVEAIITPLIYPIDIDPTEGLRIVVLCGLNGAGKTTTVGKMSYMLNKHNFKTTVAVCDTTRKAATEQAQLLTKGLNIKVITQSTEEEKPSSIAQRAIEEAKKNGSHVLLIDTPGYHPEHTESTKDTLIIVNIVKSLGVNQKHNIIVAIDASGGQKAISTIKNLATVVGADGAVITKMDLTRQAGVVISACNDLQLPLHGIGVGSGAEDLQDFSPQEFIEGLAGM